MEKQNIYRLGEIANLLNLSMKRIVDFLERKGYVIEKKKTSIIPSHLFSLIKNEFSNNKDDVKNKTSSSVKKRNEKFKPTLGKPGNYGKLIYIRKKS